MSTSSDRFYQLAFRNRPVLYGDIGSLLKIEGIIVGGAGAHAVILLPSTTIEELPDIIKAPMYALTGEEWSEYLRRSDDPEILAEDDGIAKAFHRKLRYEISGLTQQKVWRADGYACVYCNRRMGDIQLTIDHFTPLELGGTNDVSNYLSACRRCNKDKGSIDPRIYCTAQKFIELKHHLANRVVL